MNWETDRFLELINKKKESVGHKGRKGQEDFFFFFFLVPASSLEWRKTMFMEKTSN